MLELFAINFVCSNALTLTEKYKRCKREGNLRVLYAKVLDGAYPELQNLLEMDAGRRQLEVTSQRGARIVVWGHEDYPPSLNLLLRPPWVLFVQGAGLPDQPLISVIGTRRPTRYGGRAVQKIIPSLVAHRCGIISGMARGIDTLAHQSALNAGGYTLVVLGHGLDQTYPRENEKLKRQILEQGGSLCSEYLWGVKPKPYHFRDRNRINAALSDGVLVVEAGQKSGTRITVHEGLMLNKEIYSIPGPIDSCMSLFPNLLIREGAKMVTSPQDILEDFVGRIRLEPSGHLDSRTLSAKHSSDPDSKTKDALGGLILNYFDRDEARTIDALFEQSTYALPDILERITSFELRGQLIRAAEGGWVLSR